MKNNIITKTTKFFTIVKASFYTYKTKLFTLLNHSLQTLKSYLLPRLKLIKLKILEVFTTNETFIISKKEKISYNTYTVTMVNQNKVRDLIKFINMLLNF